MRQEWICDHAPNAHTDGDAIIHFVEADVIHMGDTYFKGVYPFIDNEHGGSIAGIVAAVGKVLVTAGDQTTIVPGHGPLSNKTGLRAYRDMLEDVGQQISEAVKKGDNLEAVKAAKLTASFDAEWGDGFLKPEVFVQIVYNGMQ